ncbi:GrpB family protein [candidate division KSB1 bacterium]|nr:MAG: GrpB family protein [candidate division KSB1 bacterium]
MLDKKIIGLAKGTVALHPYTLAWKCLYEEERETMKDVLGKAILDIQHVGSTSIPAMIAKPIIDIAVAVDSFEGATVTIKPLENLGYEYRGELGIPRRHYFSKGDPCTHHIHMVEFKSREWINHLAFRDYLIQHPESAKAYADLKRTLAKMFAMDRKAYTEGKAAFINKILQLADSH